MWWTHEKLRRSVATESDVHDSGAVPETCMVSARVEMRLAHLVDTAFATAPYFDIS